MNTGSPPPSHYHLLRRLVSLCYNSSPKTSYFYSGLLYDLYNAELLTGLSLPVIVAPGDEADEGTVHGDSPVKGRGRGRGQGRGYGRGRDGNKSNDPRSRPGSSTQSLELGTSDLLADGKIEMVDVPKHLALHIKGWSYINNAELYSAIHLVKEHISKSDEELETSFNWDPEFGVLNYVLGASSSSDEDDEVNSDEDRPVKPGHRTTIKGKGKQKEKIEREKLPCLECAMIYSRACEGLARFEEGRNVLERTIKTLESGLDDEEFRTFFKAIRLFSTHSSHSRAY